MEQDIEILRYPIGKFTAPDKFRKGEIKRQIKEIDKLPKRLKDAVKNLSAQQLDTPYRDGGWTIRQVVHHLADSHINSYCRFRFALTEANPTILPYLEAQWAELPDAKSGDIKLSLDLLKNLHKRWIILLKLLTKEDLHRTFFHPQKNRAQPLFEVIALYAWHSNHHLAHITVLKKRRNW